MTNSNSRRDFLAVALGAAVWSGCRPPTTLPGGDLTRLTLKQAADALEAGLPIGVQIVGAHWDENTVLTMAHAYEQSTDWHNQHPPLQSYL